MGVEQASPRPNGAPSWAALVGYGRAACERRRDAGRRRGAGHQAGRHGAGHEREGGKGGEALARPPVGQAREGEKKKKTGLILELGWKGRKEVFQK